METSVTRARIAILALIASTLVLDGVAPVAEAPEIAAPAAQALDAERIANHLASVNPHLSPREAERIGAAVMRYSAKYDLDAALVTAVLEVESTGRPWARSPKGALGLMQVMPYMLRPMGMAGNPSTIETNVEAGCLILAGNIRRLGEEDGVSAYFWGSQIRGDAYLQRVLAARARVRHLTRS